MWYLLAFEKHGKKLRETTRLPAMTLEAAREVWGGHDEELLSLSLLLDAPRAARLMRHLNTALDFDRRDYVIEFMNDESSIVKGS